MSVDVNNAQVTGGDGAVPDKSRMGVAQVNEHETENDFQSLLAAYEGRTQTFSEGEVIKGRVIAVSGNGVVVDVGFKSEGIIPIEQFTDEQGKVNVNVGD